MEIERSGITIQIVPVDNCAPYLCKVYVSQIDPENGTVDLLDAYRAETLEDGVEFVYCNYGPTDPGDYKSTTN